MADITRSLDEALKSHNAHLAQHRRSQSDLRDEFLKEAYRINSHISSLATYLLSIRASYLSTAQPHHRHRTASTSSHPQDSKDRKYFTDAQRDQIDAESKSTLRDLNASILQLEDVEQLRKDTSIRVQAAKQGRAGFRTLGRWAAGGSGPPKTAEEREEEGKEMVLGEVRENVIWYLRRKLGEAAEVQAGMMETRVEREVEKSKSVLYKTRGFRGLAREEGAPRLVNGKVRGAGGENAQTSQAEREIEQSLSPEQLQLFAHENNEMLRHYEDTLDQVRAAERSMLEISELQTTLADNLSLQSTRIDQLVEDAQGTEENVVGGNRQLKRATEKWRPAKYVFYVSAGLSVFLVAWDLVI